MLLNSMLSHQSLEHSCQCLEQPPLSCTSRSNISSVSDWWNTVSKRMSTQSGLGSTMTGVQQRDLKQHERQSVYIASNIFCVASVGISQHWNIRLNHHENGTVAQARFDHVDLLITQTNDWSLIDFVVVCVSRVNQALQAAPGRGGPTANQ